MAVKAEDNSILPLMILTRYILKVSLSVLFLLPPGISAQPAYKTLQTSDTSNTEEKESSHSFYAGGGFGSNMVFLGSTMSQDQPYGYGNLTYGFKNKLYASFSAVHLSGYDPYLSFYIGALNYNRVINSWFDISAGAYRYEVSSSLTDTLFSSFTYGDLTLGFDWKLLYTKLSVGGLLSEENQTYFQFRNSRYFQTPEFFNGKANVSFDPYANLLIGILVEVETISEPAVVVSSPGRKWKRYASPGTTALYSKKMGILEIDFGLPVSLNTDFMTIEAEINYVLPLHEEAIYTGTKGFVFTLGGFFRIF